MALARGSCFDERATDSGSGPRNRLRPTWTRTPSPAWCHEMLMGRASVVVDVATALREVGDVVIAVAAGTLDPASLRGIANLARDGVPAVSGTPMMFESVGMSWEDLVVAGCVLDRWAQGSSHD